MWLVHGKFCIYMFPLWVVRLKDCSPVPTDLASRLGIEPTYVCSLPSSAPSQIYSSECCNLWHYFTFTCNQASPWSKCIIHRKRILCGTMISCHSCPVTKPQTAGKTQRYNFGHQNLAPIILNTSFHKNYKQNNKISIYPHHRGSQHASSFQIHWPH